MYDKCSRLKSPCGLIFEHSYHIAIIKNYYFSLARSVGKGSPGVEIHLESTFEESKLLQKVVGSFCWKGCWTFFFSWQFQLHIHEVLIFFHTLILHILFLCSINDYYKSCLFYFFSIKSPFCTEIKSAVYVASQLWILQNYSKNILKTGRWHPRQFILKEHNVFAHEIFLKNLCTFRKQK